MNSYSFSRQTKIYERLQKLLIENIRLLRLSFWVLLSFILIWGFISITGIGISSNEDYWYEAGVPILPAQVLISVLAGLLFSQAEKFLISTHSIKLDQWIFLAIWLIAAFFWGNTPAPSSYFNPAPLPPNDEVYPYSDAGGYDLQSQYTLIGQGLKNGRPIDNPMYPAFLVFIHLLSGQNYPANMALQAVLFAVFPAIIYLIGKSLIGRTPGITAAMMATFRGYNSIVAASIINIASPKQMLIDFPTAIGVALSIFTLLVLFDKKRENPADGIWHGGAIGFAFLIRPTALVLLGAAPLVAFFQRFTYKSWLRIVILILTGFVIFVLPWGIRNTLRGGNVFKTYLSKVSLIAGKRFSEIQESNPIQPSEDTSTQPQVTDINNSSREILGIISSHFVHNLVGSILILPTSPALDNLRHTIKSPNAIWSASWNGAMGVKKSLTLLVSLAILSTGIAVAWKSKQITGLAPLMAFLFYQLANSIGRTSGGRYIVPVDWIIVFYYAIGLIEIFKTIFQSPAAKTIEPVSKTTSLPKNMIAALSLALIFGSIPLLIELPFPARYTLLEKETVFTNSNFQDILSHSTYSQMDISNFLKEKNSVLLSGRAMYPRYFNYRAVTRHTDGGLEQVTFPRLEFYLIGPEGTQAVALYKLSPVQLPNTTNVLILGCKQYGLNYVDAIAVVASRPENVVYLRESNPPLECPLQQPICDNNGNCK